MVLAAESTGSGGEAIVRPLIPPGARGWEGLVERAAARSGGGI
jgi:hypothetical protein